jgi:hypothetical protein
MPLSLIILDGPTPQTSHPVLATRDPSIIAVMRELLLKRLEDKPTATILPLSRPNHQKGSRDAEE